jgi:hypothetical protein
VLKATEDSIKWKAFSTEFLLTPVMALEAYITGEDMDKVTDEKLRAYGINSIFNKSRGMVVVGGVDVGKKRHPSHMSLFMNDNDGNLIQISKNSGIIWIIQNKLCESKKQLIHLGLM